MSLLAIYTGSAGGLTNNVIPDRITVESNGSISDATISTAVSALDIASPKLSSPLLDLSMDEVTVYTRKLKNIHERLKAEYDFYAKNYTVAITTLMDLLSTSSANANAINVQTDLVKILNARLNYGIQLSNEISKKLYNDARAKGTDIGKINEDLNVRAGVINKHAQLLHGRMSQMELRKSMVTYTTEKARATENLLSLYFVLNVFAIGTLLYVYKA
jgi:hypothetical protein